MTESDNTDFEIDLGAIESEAPSDDIEIDLGALGEEEGDGDAVELSPLVEDEPDEEEDLDNDDAVAKALDALRAQGAPPATTCPSKRMNGHRGTV